MSYRYKTDAACAPSILRGFDFLLGKARKNNKIKGKVDLGLTAMLSVCVKSSACVVYVYHDHGQLTEQYGDSFLVGIFESRWSHKQRDYPTDIQAGLWK